MAPKFLLALLPVLLLGLLSTAAHAARPKNDSPEKAVRDFYAAAEKYVPTGDETLLDSSESPEVLFHQALAFL